MSTLQEIEAAALRLPDKDRLHLADKILGSLQAPLAPTEPEEILAEAIRRDAELESGDVHPLTEEAFWAGVRRRSALRLSFARPYKETSTRRWTTTRLRVGRT